MLEKESILTVAIVKKEVDEDDKVFDWIEEGIENAYKEAILEYISAVTLGYCGKRDAGLRMIRTAECTILTFTIETKLISSVSFEIEKLRDKFKDGLSIKWYFKKAWFTGLFFFAYKTYSLVETKGGKRND